ncbi:hypothetical protein HYQ46_008432 [Verticillium longisporum]|nr:hypothetical protein HYQ46_008432 [Verticillium longisporum]
MNDWRSLFTRSGSDGAVSSTFSASGSGAFLLASDFPKVVSSAVLDLRVGSGGRFSAVWERTKVMIAAVASGLSGGPQTCSLRSCH